MLKKRLEIILSGLEGFARPNPRLEQYQTDSRLAALIAWIAGSSNPRRIVDLGCGTGVLSLGVTLVANTYSVCLEIDESALKAAARNARRLNVDHLYEPVLGDALHPPLRECAFDVAILNPPFGIRSRRGIDAEFLRVAVMLAKEAYSIHAYSDGLLNALRAKTGAYVEEVTRDYVMIPAFLLEHRRRVHRVLVSIVHAWGRCKG